MSLHLRRRGGRLAGMAQPHGVTDAGLSLGCEAGCPQLLRMWTPARDPQLLARQRPSSAPSPGARAVPESAVGAAALAVRDGRRALFQQERTEKHGRLPERLREVVRTTAEQQVQPTE